MAGKLDWNFDGTVLAKSSGYLWFQNIAEIENRPGYVASLTVTEGDLSHLVGGYRFRPDEEARCGLNGCNQPHQKGFVIATKDGSETVCGSVCGGKNFGMDFRDMEAKFFATAAQVTMQQSIADLKAGAGAWLERVSQLHADLMLVYGPLQKVRHQFRQERTADRLLTTLIREGGTIKRQRELTKRERDIMGNPKVRFTSETVATVRGVSALNDYARIANVLEKDLRGTIGEVQRLDDIQAVKGARLTAYSSAIQRMPNLAKEVGDFVKVARDFLTPDNLLALMRIQEMDQASATKLAPVFKRIKDCFEPRA